jgi:hypothetical protein
VAIWNILWLFGTYLFSHFGMLQQEKSGNPATQSPNPEPNRKLRCHSCDFLRRRGNANFELAVQIVFM